mgnify:CR=1 FL=1
MSLFTDLNEPGVAGVDYGNRVLLVQAFLAFENRHDVFSRNVDGMHYWHLLRKWLFDSVCKQVRRFEFGGHPDFMRSFQRLISQEACLVSSCSWVNRGAVSRRG